MEQLHRYNNAMGITISILLIIMYISGRSFEHQSVYVAT